MQWEIIDSEIVFKNDFYAIKKDRCKKQDGSMVEEYFTIQRKDVVVVAAFTQERQLVLINQYRHPVLTNDIELPAGYIEDDEDNAQKAAKRELLEETGYQVSKLEKIATTYASAGTMNNKIYFYIGLDAVKVAEPSLDPHEEIIPHVTSWKNALQLLKEGRIKDTASVTGILLAKAYLAQIDSQNNAK